MKPEDIARFSQLEVKRRKFGDDVTIRQLLQWINIQVAMDKSVLDKVLVAQVEYDEAGVYQSPDLPTIGHHDGEQFYEEDEGSFVKIF